MNGFESTVDGVVWPALTGGVDSRRLALAYQLAMSQWFSAPAFDELQQMQLASLLQYHGLSRTDLERLVRDAAHEPAASRRYPACPSDPDLNDPDPNDPDLSVACIWRARAWYGIELGAPSVFAGVDLRALGLEEDLNTRPAKTDDASIGAVLCTTSERLPTLSLHQRHRQFVGIESFGAPLGRAIRHPRDPELQLPVRDVLYEPGLGAFAFRCPEFEAWHLAGEGYFLHTIDDAVVLTPLHAFTARPTPVRVRRLSGIAPGCACGRALPRLTIHGAPQDNGGEEPISC